MSRATEAREAERSVIGALMLAAEVWDRVELDPRHFFDPRHRLIWQAAQRIIEDGQPVDVITLEADLTRGGHVEQAGGLDYLFELDQVAATTVNVEAYADLVRDAADCRAMDYAAQQLHQAIQGGADFKQAHARHQAAIDRIVRSRPAASAFVGFADLVPDAVQIAVELTKDNAEASDESGGAVVRPRRLALATGIVELDRLAGLGVEEGDMWVVAGRPSMGKTASALQLARGIAASAAEHAAGDVLVFSLETSTVKLVDRMLAQEARVEARRVGRVPLTALEIEKLQRVGPHLQQLPIYIDDSRHMAEDIARIVARWPRPVAAFFVDYIQKVRVRQRVKDRRHRIGHAAQVFKDAAKDNGSRAIILAQIGRPDTKRGPVKPPTMADLKESGDVEEIADAVLLLHRPPYYAKGTYAGDQRDAAWIVDKMREGETGSIPMLWHGPYVRFDPAPQQQTGWGSS